LKNSRMTPDQKQQTIKALLGINEGYDGSKNPELTRPPNPIKSEQIQANPAKSNQ